MSEWIGFRRDDDAPLAQFVVAFNGASWTDPVTLDPTSRQCLNFLSFAVETMEPSLESLINVDLQIKEWRSLNKEVKAMWLRAYSFNKANNVVYFMLFVEMLTAQIDFLHIEFPDMKAIGICDSLGCYNAHAVNIVSAIFMATGPDLAQNIDSSHHITMMLAHLFVTLSRLSSSMNRISSVGRTSVSKGQQEDPFRKPQPGMWGIMKSYYFTQQVSWVQIGNLTLAVTMQLWQMGLLLFPLTAAFSLMHTVV
ncbi:hypothetical protein L1987_81990 [Smallanthus sonchifolius]|uniref:Uncharacterized protein n=1 Tax=Smallanthus sonchifolius TaxID=185202 RepID=A0ACB8YSE0_9ASTR|nr:hypothetical protein L1987_81990 [Smallanthus sonchifolius]